jgi:alpha,alpha-trehalose phosphorylase
MTVGEAALMDLDDLEHNTSDGLHIASLAGTWIALVAGFGGLRHGGGVLCLSPRLPEGLTRLAFTLHPDGRTLRVEVTGTAASYSLADGEPIQIVHHGTPVTVLPGEPIACPIARLMPRTEPAQPPGREPARRRVGDIIS